MPTVGGPATFRAATQDAECITDVILSAIRPRSKPKAEREERVLASVFALAVKGNPAAGTVPSGDADRTYAPKMRSRRALL
jgi:hypothetical protein